MPKRRPSFKLAVIEMLEQHLLQRTPFPFQWNCQYCGKQHHGDLIKKVHLVRASTENDQIIELMDSDAKQFAVIWISKNKKINSDSSEQYRNAGTIYIQVSPATEEDTVLDSLSNPRFVDTCLNPRCETCTGFLIEKCMMIIDTKCWKCDAEMKVAIMETDEYHSGPDQFSHEEVDFARSKGVLIENNYSKTVEDSYLSNTCPKCKILTGDHFLFTDYYCEAKYGYLNYQTFPQGYWCSSCNDR